MESIQHRITPIRQNTSECMQTALAQMLGFFEPGLKVADVIREVPVYIDETGEKIGTSPGHLAAYCARKGYQATVYSFDVELFDRSWDGLDGRSIAGNLRRRQPHIPDNAWLAKYHHVLVDGWELYAEAGGAFSLQPLTGALLHGLLEDGPYLALVNSTYLNGSAKQRYDYGSDAFVGDPFEGRSLTHATTCAGYKDGAFLIVDPDPPEGESQERWIAQDHLIASIMAAQTESDNLLLTVKRRADD